MNLGVGGRSWRQVSERFERDRCSAHVWNSQKVLLKRDYLEPSSGFWSCGWLSVVVQWVIRPNSSFLHHGEFQGWAILQCLIYTRGPQWNMPKGIWDWMKTLFQMALELCHNTGGSRDKHVMSGALQECTCVLRCGAVAELSGKRCLF